MSGTRPNGGWPELQPDVQLPGLNLEDAETAEERLERLALAYGTMAATYHQLWPKVVQALEWLRLRLEYAVPTDRPPARDRMPSAQELEGAVERVEGAVDELEEIITGQHALPELPKVDSDRVRAIAAEEITKAENARLAAEKRADDAAAVTRRWQLAFALLGLVFAVVSSLTVWALTRK